MANVRCIVCGENIMSAGFGEEERLCPLCGRHIERGNYSKQIEELFLEALNEREDCRFDKAFATLEKIVALDRSCADAYLGMAFCRYAVLFSGENGNEPYVTELRKTKFSSDRCYKTAVQLSGGIVAAEMSNLAHKIDKIIDEMAHKSDVPPYDVVICCGENLTGGNSESEGYKTAKLLCKSFEKHRLKVYMLTENYDRLNLDDVCKRYSAVNTAKVFVNYYNSAKEANSEFFSVVNSRILKLTDNTFERHFLTAYCESDKRKMPKLPSAQRAFPINLPEQKTELAVLIRGMCDASGRYGYTTALPIFDNTEFSQRLKNVYTLLENKSFENAKSSLIELYREQPNNVSVLWATLLLKRSVSSEAELLRLCEPIIGDPVCKNILNHCDEGVRNRLYKIETIILHNIHICFMSAAKAGNTEAAEHYMKLYEQTSPRSRLVAVHRAVFQSMDGSFCAALPGALLLCISYYNELPFSVGSENAATIANYYSVCVNVLFEKIKILYQQLTAGENNSAESKELAKYINCICAPREAFEAQFNVPTKTHFPMVGDDNFSRFYFMYSRLSELLPSPNEWQQKILDFCKSEASAVNPQEAELFGVVPISQHRKKISKIKRFKRDAVRVITPVKIPSSEKKNGGIQVFLSLLLILLALPTLVLSVLINIYPDRLLQYDRLWFVVISVAAVFVWGAIITFVSASLYRARNNRRHLKAGKLILSVSHILSALLSGIALVLTVVSALLFGARMNTIYLSSAREFSYIRNYPNGSYVLSKDIVADESTLLVFGRFSGVLDGNGHTITGAKISSGFFIVENSGTLTNICFDEAYFANGLIKENSGSVSDITFKDCSFGDAVTGTNNGAFSAELLGCTLNGGSVVKENNGELTNVLVQGAVVTQSESRAYAINNNLYTGVLVNSNSGVIGACSVSKSNVTVTSQLLTSGGLVGINTGSITGCTADKLYVAGKASVFGGLTGRNAGSCQNNSVSLEELNIGIARSFGGFTGENSFSISECSSVANGRVYMVSSADERRTAGAFAGYSSGSFTNCKAGGSLSVESNIYCDTALFVGCFSGLQEGDMQKIFTEAGIDVYQSGIYGETQVFIGGIAGKLKNCSIKECERTGRLFSSFSVFNTENIPENERSSSKFQPDLCVGGLAGGVESDENNKNEEISDVRLSGIVQVDEDGGGSLEFGTFFGETNCAHVFSNSFSLAYCTIESNGRISPEIGIAAGEITDIEKISGVFFSGRISIVGKNLVNVSFAPGKEDICSSCYVKDTAGLSATDISSLPEEVFSSSEFVFADLKWDKLIWSVTDGTMPVLKCFSEK